MRRVRYDREIPSQSIYIISSFEWLSKISETITQEQYMQRQIISNIIRSKLNTKIYQNQKIQKLKDHKQHHQATQ